MDNFLADILNVPVHFRKATLLQHSFLARRNINFACSSVHLDFASVFEYILNFYGRRGERKSILGCAITCCLLFPPDALSPLPFWTSKGRSPLDSLVVLIWLRKFLQTILIIFYWCLKASPVLFLQVHLGEIYQSVSSRFQGKSSSLIAAQRK